MVLIIIRITHPILHEGTWHETFCVFNELFCIHEKYPELFIIILTQRSLIFTQIKSFHIWFHPRWLTSCLSQNASFYTSRKIVIWIFLTCTWWRLVELFMSYCLKRLTNRVWLWGLSEVKDQGLLMKYTFRKILTYPDDGFNVIMVLEISPGTSVNDCNFRSIM